VEGRASLNELVGPEGGVRGDPKRDGSDSPSSFLGMRGLPLASKGGVRSSCRVTCDKDRHKEAEDGGGRRKGFSSWLCWIKRNQVDEEGERRLAVHGGKRERGGEGPFVRRVR